MGTLTKKGCPDRSAFNLEKWKPLINLPFRISHYCCNIMKKNPTKKYAKETGLKPMTGEMAQESRLRTEQWLKNGCNGFDMKEPKSTPMVFWLEQDVLQYIKENNIEIPSVYGEIVYDYELEGCEQICFLDKEKKLKTTGCSRTGCCFCGFGCYLEKGKTRFQRLKETHPKLYEYCMNGGEFDSEGLWIPNKKGLGLKFVFDKLNEIYGKDFIRYE